MTIEPLRAAIRAQPFVPFRLHLADGGTLDVSHPDFLSSTPGGRTIIVYTGGESFQIVDRLLVSRLEVSNGKPTPR